MLGDLTPQVAISGASALLLIVLGATFRLVLLQWKQSAAYEARIEELEADCSWCGMQRDAMIDACHRGNVAVPPVVWTLRPRNKKGHAADDTS